MVLLPPPEELDEPPLLLEDPPLWEEELLFPEDDLSSLDEKILEDEGLFSWLLLFTSGISQALANDVASRSITNLVKELTFIIALTYLHVLYVSRYLFNRLSFGMSATLMSF